MSRSGQCWISLTTFIAPNPRADTEYRIDSASNILYSSRSLIVGVDPLGATMTHRRVHVLRLAALLSLPAQSALAQPMAPQICPATVTPSRPFAEPSPSSSSRFWYGSEALAALLNRSGAWDGMGAEHDYRNKLFWWRQGYSGTKRAIAGAHRDGQEARWRSATGKSVEGDECPS